MYRLRSNLPACRGPTPTTAPVFRFLPVRKRSMNQSRSPPGLKNIKQNMHLHYFRPSNHTHDSPLYLYLGDKPLLARNLLLELIKESANSGYSLYIIRVRLKIRLFFEVQSSKNASPFEKSSRGEIIKLMARYTGSKTREECNM